MQEQNFEQQVRQRLDKLSLPPSPPVWDKVSEEIKGKKDKRRFILWLLPLLLVSSAIGWWTISTTSKPLTIATESIIPSKQNSTKKEIKNSNPSTTSDSNIESKIKSTTTDKEKRNIEVKATNLSHGNSYSFKTELKKSNTTKGVDLYHHRTTKTQKKKVFKESTPSLY